MGCCCWLSCGSDAQLKSTEIQLGNQRCLHGASLSLQRPPAERKTDSISTQPKLTPACTKSRESATPAGARCDARFYTRNGGAPRSQERHPRTLRESLHTNRSARSWVPGGHEAVGTRLPPGQADGPRTAQTPHAAAAEHRPASQLLRAAVGTPLSAGVTHAC